MSKSIGTNDALKLPFFKVRVLVPKLKFDSIQEDTVINKFKSSVTLLH